MLKNQITSPLSNPNSTRANIFWAATQQVVEKTAGYVVIAVLTRTLLQVELGTLFFCLSIAELTAVFLSFGTNSYLIRTTAADPENSLEHLSRVLSARLLNTGVGYILLNLIVMAIRPEISPVLLLVSGYDFLEEIYYCFSAFFIGRKRLIYRLFLLGGFKIVALFGVSLAAYLSRTLFPVLWTYLFLDFLLVIIAYWLVLKQFGQLTLRLDVKESLSLMRETTPFFLQDLLHVLHIRFDTIMVGVMLNLVQVAVYELGIKMFEVTRMLVRPLINVFFPLFSEYAAQERWRLFRRRYMQLSLAVLGLGILLVIGMQAFGQYVIVFLFSETYRESVIPTQILFWGVPFIYLTTLNTIAANAIHLEKKVTLVTGVSVWLNICLNLLLIPRYGIIGAAWTTVISQALEAVGIIILVMTNLFKRKKGANS